MSIFKLFIALCFCIANTAFAQSEVARPRVNQSVSGSADATRVSQIPGQGQCFPQIQSWVDQNRNAFEIGEIVNNQLQSIKSTAGSVFGFTPELNYNSAGDCDRRFPVQGSSVMNVRERHSALWSPELSSDLHASVRRCQGANPQQERDVVDRFYASHIQIEEYSQAIIEQLAAVDALIPSSEPILLGRPCAQFSLYPQLKSKCENLSRCPRHSEDSKKKFFEEGAAEYEVYRRVEQKLSELKTAFAGASVAVSRAESRGSIERTTRVQLALQAEIRQAEELKAQLLAQHPHFSGAPFKRVMDRDFRGDLSSEQKRVLFERAFNAQNQENRRLLNLELMRMESLRSCLTNSSSIAPGCEDRDKINRDLLKTSQRVDWQNKFSSQRRPDRDLQKGLQRQMCLVENTVDRQGVQETAGEIATEVGIFVALTVTTGVGGVLSAGGRGSAVLASRLSRVASAVEVGGSAYYTSQAVQVAAESCGQERAALQREMARMNQNQVCPSIENPTVQAVNELDNCVLDSMLAGAEALGFGVAVKVARNVRQGARVAPAPEPIGSRAEASPNVRDVPEAQAAPDVSTRSTVQRQRASADRAPSQYGAQLQQIRNTEDLNALKNDPEFLESFGRNVGISRDNPIFNEGRINAFGRTESYEDFVRSLIDLERRSPGFLARTNGSSLFHGSNSSSLLSFTGYGGQQGRLLPVGILEREGKIPFSGAIDLGRVGVNQNFLSTVPAPQVMETLRYTGTTGFVPAEARKAISEAQRLLRSANPGSLSEQQLRNVVEVETRRLQEFEKLTPLEKELVQNPFPIVYGVNPARAGSTSPVKSDVSREIGVLNGAQKDEIKVLFVPQEKIEFTRRLLTEQLGTGHGIKVESLDVVPKPRRGAADSSLSRDQTLNRNANLSPEQKARELGIRDRQQIQAIRDVEKAFETPVSDIPVSLRPRVQREGLVLKRQALRRAGISDDVIDRGMREGYFGAPQPTSRAASSATAKASPQIAQRALIDSFSDEVTANAPAYRVQLSDGRQVQGQLIARSEDNSTLRFKVAGQKDPVEVQTKAVQSAERVVTARTDILDPAAPRLELELALPARPIARADRNGFLPEGEVLYGKVQARALDDQELVEVTGYMRTVQTPDGRAIRVTDEKGNVLGEYDEQTFRVERVDELTPDVRFSEVRGSSGNVEFESQALERIPRGTQIEVGSSAGRVNGRFLGTSKGDDGSEYLLIESSGGVQTVQRNRAQSIRTITPATPRRSQIIGRARPPIKEIQRNAKYSPAQKAEQLEVVLGRPTGSLKNNSSFVRELERIETQFPTPVSPLPAARRPKVEQQNLVRKREELLKLKDAQGRPLFTREEIQRGMDHGLLGTPDELGVGSSSILLARPSRVLDSAEPPPLVQPTKEMILQRLQRARQEKSNFDYRSVVEPQLGEVGPAFSGAKGSAETLRNGFGGARNAGVEIVQGPERPLFVKISTFTAESSSLRAFNNEVFFTQLMSDLGRGPEFHGVFSRRQRAGAPQYVAPDNLRIMTDAVPGENFQLSATTAETVRNFSFSDIDAIEKEAFSIVNDLNILPGDFQVRVARRPNGDPKVYIVDPAQYSFINGDGKQARQYLSQGFQEMRSKKIVTSIEDRFRGQLESTRLTQARSQLEKMSPEEFRVTLERFRGLAESEWPSFIRSLSSR